MSENKITVKPLVWERDEDGWHYVQTICGLYEARVTDRGAVRIRKPSNTWQEFDGDIDAAFAHLFSDYEQRILSAIDTSALTASQEEVKRLEAEKPKWQPISTCPLRMPVDLWCVWGGEEYARYDGGASIGQLVVNRFKHEEYGFFGNQSNDGVPRGHAKDLVPVAWRQAVEQCPAELIAEVLGIPLTLEEASAALNGEGK